MNNYEFKISQFIDNELPVIEQHELFRFLVKSEEARRTLADYMEMKRASNVFYSELNTEFDASKAVRSILINQNSKENKYKIMFYFSAAAVIVLAFLLFSNSFKNNIELKKYEGLSIKYVSLQKDYSSVLGEKIKLVKLTNRLTSEIGNSKSVQVLEHKKPIEQIKQPNTKFKHSVKRTVYRRNVYASNIPVIKITKDDFLGQQIIGN